MNELTLTLIRVAFLAVLWLFVIAAIGVVRTALLGTAVEPRRGRNRPAPVQRQARPAKPVRGTARQLIVTAGSLKGTQLGLDTPQITLGRANDAKLVLHA